MNSAVSILFTWKADSWVFQIKSKHGECNYCHATRHALQYNCQKV